MAAPEVDASSLRGRTIFLRRQIVALLAASEFGLKKYADPATIDPICEALGVTRAALTEAVRIARRMTPIKRSDRADKSYSLMLRVSSEQDAVVRELCAEKRWAVAPLCRTLIDRFLHQAEAPKFLVPTKRGRMKWHPELSQYGATAHRYDIKMPPIMRKALNARAAILGLEVSVVVRALLLDVLAGKEPPPDRLLALGELTARAVGGYLLPEAFAEIG